MSLPTALTKAPAGMPVPLTTGCPAVSSRPLVPVRATAVPALVGVELMTVKPLAIRVVPVPMLSAPVPTGPLASVSVPAVAAVVPVPAMSVPPFKLNPFVKVFRAVSTREPLPVLLRVPAVGVMLAEIIRPVGESPETLMTGFALLNSSVAAWVALVNVPLMVGVEPKLSFTTVIALALVKTSLLN